MMKVLNVVIDDASIRIDDDPATAYQFTPYYLEKLAKEKESLTDDELAQFGKNIYDNIFATPKRKERLNHLLDELSDQNSLGLKISSNLEHIHNIPFELINNDGTKNGFLLKRGNIAVVRNIPTLDKEINVFKVPIKILLLLSLPLETYIHSPLDPLKELDVIYQALDVYIRSGVVEIDVEERVNIPRIRERLLTKEYDIVHFIGHGAKGGKLVIENEKQNKKEYYLKASELKEIFKNSNIKLFYFNACQTGKSDLNFPSLAYQIYKEIDTAYVLANLASVSDKLATETTSYIYETIFGKREIGNLLYTTRLKLHTDWWKPVFYGEPEKELFRIDEQQIEKKEEKRVVIRLTETIQKYVYRYGIVRQASDLIEKSNYLVLHGIGGAGKSTMANYLSRFYDAKFRHVLFLDLNNFDTTTPEPLLDEILSYFRRNQLIDAKQYTELYTNLASLSQKDRVLDKWDVIKSKICVVNSPTEQVCLKPNKTLLILDNLENKILDEQGIIILAWRDLINEILNTTSIFTIFTSRIIPYLTERQPLENILEIGEYSEADVRFLLRDLSQKDQEYLIKNYAVINSYFGLHPLTISKAIEKKFTDPIKLLQMHEFKKILEFYRKYFNKYKKDTQKLFTLEYPFSNTLAESIFNPEFIDLIKNKLLILQNLNSDKGLSLVSNEASFYLPYKVLTSYFYNDFIVENNCLNEFAFQLLKVYQEKEISGIDIINVFSIAMCYYKKSGDKKIENNLVEVFNQINFERAPKFTKEMLDRFIKILDTFSIEITTLATTYNNLASAYQAKGDYDIAIPFYEKALGIRESKLGVDHPSTATTYNNIAGAYRAQGNFDKAIEFFKKALKIKETKLGKNHPSTATTYNNLALAYQDKGNLDMAIEFFEKALKIIETKLGFNHPDTAITYNNMAVAYKDKGNLDMAIEFFEKALKISETKLGLDHPNTAMTYNNLAIAYQSKGDYDKAIAFYEKALNISTTKIGIDHPYTATTYNNLSAVYQDKGDYNNAIEFLEKALKIKEIKLELDHPSIATSYNNLAMAYQGKGDYDKAIEFCQQALKIIETKLGLEHPSTATIYNNIALAYLDKGNIDKAIAFFEKAFEIRKTKLGIDHLDTGATYNNLGGAYRAKGDFDTAIAFYEKALKIAEEKLEENHPYIARTFSSIGVVYMAKGDYINALEYFEKSLLIYKRRKDNIDILMVYSYLINCFIKIKNFSYPVLTSYLCDFLQLFEPLFSQQRPAALKIITNFSMNKTFDKIDINNVKDHIKYPGLSEKLDWFIGLVNKMNNYIKEQEEKKEGNQPNTE